MNDELSRFGAIVAAAGLSTRMGVKDKLVTPFRGRPLIEHILHTIGDLGIEQILIVAGENAAELEKLCLRYGAEIAVNTHPKEGMGSSLAVGAGRLAATLSGVFVVPGDMPLIQSSTFLKLGGAMDADPTATAAVPVFGDQRGHPVLFAASQFAALTTLSGDQGARALLAGAKANVVRVEVEDRGIHVDLDTDADFAKYA